MAGPQLVQVVTDSTADIPPEVAEAAGVVVVPLSIRFGDETFKDGVNLSGEEFYRKLATSPSLPTT
ncbi:MAG: DegV family protein, partial [Chloroflexota bacterium]